MDTTQQYILRDGRFIRQIISESDLGTQQDMIRKIASESGGYFCPEINRVNINVPYHVRDPEGISLQVDNWDLPIHILSAETTISLVSPIPYVTFGSVMTFGSMLIGGMTRYVVYPNFSSTYFGPGATRDKNLTLRILPPNGTEFFFATVHNRNDQSKPNFVEAYLIALKDNKIFGIPCTNVHNTGKLCLGQLVNQWEEKELRNPFLAHFKVLENTLFESWNADLLTSLISKVLLWDAKTFCPVHETHPNQIQAANGYNIVAGLASKVIKSMIITPKETIELEIPWLTRKPKIPC